MYRYLLFYCPDYYPGGGMRDCELKTNNKDELVPFINKHYADHFMSSIHCYDTVEDKVWYAVMDEYTDENDFPKQRFIAWSGVEL